MTRTPSPRHRTYGCGRRGGAGRGRRRTRPARALGIQPRMATVDVGLPPVKLAGRTAARCRQCCWRRRLGRCCCPWPQCSVGGRSAPGRSQWGHQSRGRVRPARLRRRSDRRWRSQRRCTPTDDQHHHHDRGTADPPVVAGSGASSRAHWTASFPARTATGRRTVRQARRSARRAQSRAGAAGRGRQGRARGRSWRR